MDFAVARDKAAKEEKKAVKQSWAGKTDPMSLAIAEILPVQLRAKLHRLSRFSPHNGPNEGLAHADDPVRYAVGTVSYMYFCCS